MVSLPYYSFRQWMRDRYGAPLHRVPVNFGFGCPHREADGSGGCAFCAEDGARAVYVPVAPLERQVAAGVAFARRRYGATRFMAYVQAFTGTFAAAERQHALYERLLAAHAFDALAVATRPDCLPDAALDLLGDLRTRLDVWVELGVQTTHDSTLRAINRGHDWDTARRAILRLHERGLRPAAHVIVGLPGETPDDFHATAERLAELPVQGVKIHNLHVIRGTELARRFAERPFQVFDANEYTELAIDFLRRTRPDVAIVRLNTDTPAAALIAPRWSVSKSRFLAALSSEMQRRGVRQGDLCRHR